MANEKALALTDRTILGLKKPDKKKWLRDGGGLALCLTPAKSGAWRHWYFIYISPESGNKRYKPLGSYPEVTLGDARKIATRLRSDVEKNLDPIAEEMRIANDKLQVSIEQKRLREEEDNALTVSQLIDAYIERHAKRHKKSWAEDQRILDKEVRSIWGARKAKNIQKKDLLALLENIVIRPAPVMANNTFKIIRRLFNWSIEQDLLPSSPAYMVKLPSPKIERDRRLSVNEVRVLWKSLDSASMSIEVTQALKMVLITAQRPGEVSGMHTSEIDGRWWTIPANRSKNGKSHRVYLSDLALEIVQGMLPDASSRYVFASPRSKATDVPSTPISRHALSRALTRNFEWPVMKDGKQLHDGSGRATTENRIGVQHFTPHDLRRTAATFMAEAGEMDEVIDAILNHTKQGVIKVYNQYRYDTEKKKALESWAYMLTAILSPYSEK